MLPKLDRPASFADVLILLRRQCILPSYRSPAPPQPYFFFSMQTLRIAATDDSLSWCRLKTVPCPFTLGRGTEADVVISDRWASRVHCVIELREGQPYLRDLNSVHGILVNREPITECFLEDGDEIAIGLTLLTVSQPTHDDQPITIWLRGESNPVMSAPIMRAKSKQMQSEKRFQFAPFQADQFSNQA